MDELVDSLVSGPHIEKHEHETPGKNSYIRLKKAVKYMRT